MTTHESRSDRNSRIRRVWRLHAWRNTYFLTAIMLFPVNVILALIMRPFYVPRSVVHIGQSRHLIWNAAQQMKDRGVRAIFVAVGENRNWSRFDHLVRDMQSLFFDAIRDMWTFWTVIAHHEVVHCHCMMGISHYQWEFPILKLLGRTIIAHFRGCEARERAINMARHPDVNICQDCDYFPRYLCESRENKWRRWVARTFADRILVTTPDLRDFFPDARVSSFFLPYERPPEYTHVAWSPDQKRSFRIVHVTNQPGIEQSSVIFRIVARLVSRGWPIDLIFLTNRPHDEVLREIARSDLCIGKLTMGYYSNVQVESMALGVPTITWIRDDLMTPQLAESPFIFSTLADLEATLEKILRNPKILANVRQKSHDFIARHHDGDAIVRDLCAIYGWGDR